MAGMLLHQGNRRVGLLIRVGWIIGKVAVIFGQKKRYKKKEKCLTIKHADAKADLFTDL